VSMVIGKNTYLGWVLVLHQFSVYNFFCNP
jgi:hypothetical protein